jgi:mannose-6-phosphate isomerase-like protein (cupin superfamily)
VSDFTRTNLREDIRDASEGSDVAGLVEARLARSSLNSDHLGVSFFRYSPGFRTPFGHRHREQEEAYVVVGGSGRMKLDEEIIEMRQWDVVRVAPEVTRAIEGGEDGLELIAIGGPRPEEGDGESEPNWWPQPQL